MDSLRWKHGGLSWFFRRIQQKCWTMLNLWGKYLFVFILVGPQIPKKNTSKAAENSEVRSQGPQPGLPLPSPQGTSQLLALREELQRLRNRVALVEGWVRIPEACWGEGTCRNIKYLIHVIHVVISHMYIIYTCIHVLYYCTMYCTICVNYCYCIRL